MERMLAKRVGSHVARVASSDQLLETDFSEATLNNLNQGSIDSSGNFSERWEETLRRSVLAIVSIKVNLVRSFDTERATSTQGTGFVVDAERGIILTNRHIINPGPVTAETVFHDHEEVPVWPIYRDPVHDFGFMQFDVSKIRYQKVMAIPLAPDKARVGTEIRVVGNDAGEKLSILTGTIARLDRRAPVYGVGKYNDFNTFYFQAASGTSGGSSGSPVLDINGNAVAMNAGGLRKAASSFYIPLFRVERALKLIQAGKPVTRGTLQTVFKYEPYDEVRRLGLSSEAEDVVRATHPGNTGMLVIDQVLPKGPAAGKLQPGDVLVSINKEIVVGFVRVEEICDDAVGETIEINVHRGGESLTFEVTVQDLHAITPDRFVSISGSVLHDLSYMMAYSYHIPVEGVYVSSPGYMLFMAGIQRNAIITAVDSKPVPTLQDFVQVMKDIPDNARVPFRFVNLSDLHKEQFAIVHIDRHWHHFLMHIRDDTTGLWAPVHIPATSEWYQPAPATATFVTLDKTNLAVAASMVRSLVTVEFFVPFSIDGVQGTRFLGTGVVLDADKGIVVVDSNTVPVMIGDLSIIISASVIIPAKILYQHQLYNIVVIQYDPVHVGDTPLKSVHLSSVDLEQGDEVYLIGLSKDQRIVSRKTMVSDVREISFRECSPPRFRPVNVEAIEVETSVQCQGGVLCDNEGNVQGLWISYSYQDQDGEDHQFNAGLAIKHVLPVLLPLQLGEQPRLRSLDVELWPCPLAHARSLGVSNDWIQKVGAANPRRRSVLAVRRLVAETPAASLLREGDVILTVDGKVLTEFMQVDGVDKESLALRIVRGREELELTVPTVELRGCGTDRLIGWAGVILQHPHRAAFQQRREIPGYVYSSWWSNGSPANMYGLRATIWITEINGQKVHDLESFLSIVKATNFSEEYLRVQTIDFANRIKVLTIKPDYLYWPLWELCRDAQQPSGWRLILHSPEQSAKA